MVYKKYLRKRGRIFGPYYYESYRENGEVKTRFISGPRKIDKIVKKFRKINFLFLSVIFLFVLLFIGIYFKDTIEKILFAPTLEYGAFYGRKQIDMEIPKNVPQQIQSLNYDLNLIIKNSFLEGEGKKIKIERDNEKILIYDAETEELISRLSFEESEDNQKRLDIYFELV